MIKYRAFTNKYGIIDVQEIDFRFKTIEFYIYIDKAPYAKEESLDDIELMQSTGFKDKHGTEIFVGDILEYEMVMGFGWYENGKDVVVYDEEELKIKMKYRNENSLNRVVTIGCEVVGNIYENRELLEE